nr:DUF2835 domain-containing protein [Agarilytica rhodophyticola]
MSFAGSSIIVDLNISAEEYLKLYQGSASSVLARSRDRRTIRFPAQVLRPFVTRDGVSGAFCIYFDKNMKFLRIDRVS